MYEAKINTLAHEIKKQKIALDITAKRFNETNKAVTLDKFNADYWCHIAFSDSLAKLSILTENNFNSIETFGLISIARYIFELNIRLNLIERDSRYGLAYYGQLIKDQINYWGSFKKQLEREITFLREMEDKERSLQKIKLSEYNSIEDEKLKEKIGSTLTTDILTIIDNTASRKFSIHAEQAQINGYKYQAHSIEKKQLPKVALSLESVENELKLYESSVPQDVLKLLKGWQWKKKAKETNHVEEYEFIYTFTSRMLHATPANITTESKLLSYQEMIIFLKYINVKLKDINELSTKFIKNFSMS